MSDFSYMGTGMTIVQTIEDGSENSEAWQVTPRHRVEFGIHMWDCVAAYYAHVLELAGLVTIGIEGKEYSQDEIDAWKGIYEHDLEASASDYLRHYHYFKVNLELSKSGKLPDEQRHFIFEHIFKMGQIHERQFWRSGIDPLSGRVRETLALSGRKQVKGGHDGNAMKAQKSFKATFGAEAQARADDLYRENPRRTWTRIREILGAEYNVSTETIKKALSNPKKNG